MIYHLPAIITIENQFVISGQSQYFQFGEEVAATGTKSVADSNQCNYNVGLVLDLNLVIALEDGQGTLQFISTNADPGQSNVIPVTAEASGDFIAISFGSGQSFNGQFGVYNITAATITGEIVIDTSNNPSTASGSYVINVTAVTGGTLDSNGLPCNLAVSVS